MNVSLFPAGWMLLIRQISANLLEFYSPKVQHSHRHSNSLPLVDFQV